MILETRARSRSGTTESYVKHDKKTSMLKDYIKKNNYVKHEK